MRVAGRLAAEVLDMIGPHVVPGRDHRRAGPDLPRLHRQRAAGRSRAARLPGFPKSICTSVNHVVCHGIPGDKKLKHGDIVNVDVTVIKDGFHGDTSRMFHVGKPLPQRQRLVDVTHEAMWLGIRRCGRARAWATSAHAIQKFAEANHFSVVREYCGHGIGRVFHEDPQVLHYGTAARASSCEAGMTFTIEPMVNAGRRHVRLLPDGWTVVTKTTRCRRSGNTPCS